MTQSVKSPVHKIINRGGAAIWLPPSCFAYRGIPSPDIYAQSADQIFPLGSKLEFADGRVFRYGQFAETSTTPLIARMVANQSLAPGATGGSTYGYEGTLDATSDYAVGSTKLIMDDTTDRAENYYEDGMLAVYPSGHYVEYRIAGNDVAATVDDVTIYLDDPLGLQTALVVSSTGITAYPSIFKNTVYADAAGYETPTGVLLASGMTSTYFAWIQRSGRAIITPTAYFGDSANERLAMYWSDATIATAATADPSSGYMIVGYLTQRTQSSYGDLEVWLTLE
jgi:hypothetical protein